MIRQVDALILDNYLSRLAVVGHTEDAKVDVPCVASVARNTCVVCEVPGQAVGRVKWFFTSVIVQGVLEVPTRTVLTALSEDAEVEAAAREDGTVVEESRKVATHSTVYLPASAILDDIGS